jgi:hypothetical protein
MEDKSVAASGARQWHPLEYAHVFLWLIKDLCWAQGWKTAGSAMVAPAILVAVVITWNQRREGITFIHNFAVTLWIASNSLWMLAEFYGREASLKPISTIGFLLGIFLLLAAYGHLFWKNRQVKTRKKA